MRRSRRRILLLAFQLDAYVCVVDSSTYTFSLLMFIYILISARFVIYLN